jgi:hypothetical protein
MFEQLRASLRSLLDNSIAPAERRDALAGLKEALVHAKMGVDDLRKGVDASRARTVAAREELETIRRRKGLAARIKDAETVAVAERFEALQAERVAVLERKQDAQERELALAEREVAEMSADFRRAVAGVGSGSAVGDRHERAAQTEVDSLVSGGDEADAQRRADDRARRTADADARLAELKRRMGK